MTKTEQHGNRAHARRRIPPVSYVELGQENGGILLNLSEGGLAMRSALPLASREFTGIRFQAPASHAWLTASGRIVWLSDSKKEGGIQFTELPGEARQQIHKWVSAEGVPEDARESLPASSYGGREPSKQTLVTSDREGGGACETVIVRGDRPRAAPTQRERVPTQTETAGVAAAEPPAQAFRFTDYSMFAAEPEKEGAWIEPTLRRRGWGGKALVVLFVAALFFTLGSTVGRGSVDRLIAYLASAAENQLAPPPKVTPPAPPEQADATGAAEDQTDAKSASVGDQQKSDEGANPTPGPAANSQVATTPATEKKDLEPKGATEPRGNSAAGGVSTADSRTRSALVPGTNESGPRLSTESAMPRDNREMDAQPSKTATEHSILVNPPGPGGRPFYVNLPAETISASPAIAISAQRTLQIQPTAFGRSERVVIGILKSHSEPFYPVEARKQRIEGSVELRARVGRTGQIIGVTPVRGPGLLASAATAAVREWRYEPTFIDGDPVETQADITIVFRLQ
jgi:TonB family protein